MAGRFDNLGKPGYGVRGGTAAMGDLGGDTLDILSRAAGGPVSIDLSVFRNPTTGVLEQDVRTRSVTRTGELTPWVSVQSLPVPGGGSVAVGGPVSFTPATRTTPATYTPIAQPQPTQPISPPVADPRSTPFVRPPIIDYLPPSEPTLLPFQSTSTGFDPIAQPGTTINGFNPAPLVAAGASVCGRLSGSARVACELAVGALGGVFKSGGAQPATGPTQCPTGYKPSADGGCQLEGAAPYIPGDIGRPDFAWQPVRGNYGIGVAPGVVAVQARRCPAGFKLGKDGVCYNSIARTNRAHNPGARPLLTGGDMNSLRRARQLQKTIGKISRAHGKKPCNCKSGPARARKK